MNWQLSNELRVISLDWGAAHIKPSRAALTDIYVLLKLKQAGYLVLGGPGGRGGAILAGTQPEVSDWSLT